MVIKSHAWSLKVTDKPHCNVSDYYLKMVDAVVVNAYSCYSI